MNKINGDYYLSHLNDRTKLIELVERGSISVNCYISEIYSKLNVPLVFAIISEGDDKTFKCFLKAHVNLSFEFEGQSWSLIDYVYYTLDCYQWNFYETTEALALVENNNLISSLTTMLHSIVDYIVQLSPRSREGRQLQRVSQLYQSIFINDIDSVQRLLDAKGVNSIQVLHKPEQLGIAAAKLQHINILKCFIEKQIGDKINYFWCKLHGNSNNMEIFKEDYNINMKDDNGNNILYWIYVKSQMTQNLNLKWVRLLVEKFDIDLEETNNLGDTILLSVVRNKFFRIMHFMEDFPCVNVNHLWSLGHTLLHEFYPLCEVYSTLLEHGADPSIQDPIGIYPIHYCHTPEVLRQDCSVIELLKKLIYVDTEYVNKKLPCIFGHLQNLTITDELKVKCAIELEKLRSIQICEATMKAKSQTMFDFMYFQPHKISQYSRNEVIIEAYKKSTNNFKNDFPLYGFILNHQLRRGTKRRKLMNSTAMFMHAAFGNKIPEHITDEIFQYLSDNKLRQLRK